jgi:hypothetical protein
MIEKENFIPEFTEILTSEGWLEISKCNFKQPILLIRNGKLVYLKPKLFSSYLYKGDLVQIETESCSIFLKPSTIIWVNDKPKKANLVRKGDYLDKYFLHQEVVKTHTGLWEGKVYSMQFETDLLCLLPIKFEQDYSLIAI